LKTWYISGYVNGYGCNTSAASTGSSKKDIQETVPKGLIINMVLCLGSFHSGKESKNENTLGEYEEKRVKSTVKIS